MSLIFGLGIGLGLSAALAITCILAYAIFTRRKHTSAITVLPEGLQDMESRDLVEGEAMLQVNTVVTKVSSEMSVGDAMASPLCHQRYQRDVLSRPSVNLEEGSKPEGIQQSVHERTVPSTLFATTDGLSRSKVDCRSHPTVREEVNDVFAGSVRMNPTEVFPSCAYGELAFANYPDSGVMKRTIAEMKHAGKNKLPLLMEDRSLFFESIVAGNREEGAVPACDTKAKSSFTLDEATSASYHGESHSGRLAVSGQSMTPCLVSPAAGPVLTDESDSMLTAAAVYVSNSDARFPTVLLTSASRNPNAAAVLSKDKLGPDIVASEHAADESFET
jgi:hypothetical protein